MAATMDSPPGGPLSNNRELVSLQGIVTPVRNKATHG